MKKCMLACFLLAAAASACTTISVVAPATVSERVGTHPELGRPSTANVGDPLFSQFRYWARTGYRLKAPYAGPVAGMRVIVTPEDFLHRSQANGQTAYCTERKAAMSPLAFGPVQPACFVDASNSGSFTKVMVPADVVWWDSSISPGAAYEQFEDVRPVAGSIKRELLFQGISKGTIKLAYREFINDMARPAFFQDASYDVDTFPATVSFRGAQIEITAANNSGLKYRVLSGF